MTNEKPSSYVKDTRLIEYTLEDKWTVLVGRTEKDNDSLSLKIAKANDWWFHVRGMSGSHVVLEVLTGEDPGKDILKMTASIAAYHSKAKKGGVVAVSCTRARYVTKTRGAKPGTVQIRKESVLKVRPGLGEAVAVP